jgi:membrane complex biogenesis BtpA family protein
MGMEIFNTAKPVIGTIHLLPLPGAANWEGNLSHLYARAEQEATALASSGINSLLLENFYDIHPLTGRPYRIDQTSAMTMALIAQRLRQFTDLPLGITIYPNDPQTSLGLALNIHAEFIRIPLLLGAKMTEQGMIEGALNDLVNYQKQLKLEEIPPIFADISIHHLTPGAHPSRTNISLVDYLGQAILNIQKHPLTQRFMGGFILSEREVTPADVQKLKSLTHLPILVGEQLTPDEVQDYYPVSDGLILGSGFKKPIIAGLDPRTSIDITKLETVMHQLGLPKSVTTS